MTKPHGQDALGRPVDLIGQPLAVRPSPAPKVVILGAKEMQTMAKAEKDGVYTLNGGRFKVRAGDVLPEGAEMVTDEQRSKGAAPENKAKAAAPENRAAKKSDA